MDGTKSQILAWFLVGVLAVLSVVDYVEQSHGVGELAIRLAAGGALIPLWRYHRGIHGPIIDQWFAAAMIALTMFGR